MILRISTALIFAAAAAACSSSQQDESVGVSEAALADCPAELGACYDACGRGTPTHDCAPNCDRQFRRCLGVPEPAMELAQ
jgi:hypothetical protein